MRQRSAAWFLAAAFAALVVYASLYPFEGWRWPPGRTLGDLLRLPWPPYRLPFDESANLLGYLPLGALVCVALLRSGHRVGVALALAVLAPAALSLALEVVQHLLPQRVPSAKDWALNAAGAALGALLAAAAHALGLIDRWQALRERWFVSQSAGALVLLVLWPVGLLFPAPLPLGLGQVADELRAAATAALADTPWADPAWLLPPPAAAPLSPLGEGLAVALGLLGPCLVAFAVTRRGFRRLLLVVGAALLAVATTTLSTALNFGPPHALTWLTPVVLPALGAGALVAMGCSALGRRVAAGLGLVVLSAHIALVAQAPSDPYFAASLQAWEQGRFIRFHGLARWVGWLWPYLAMGWLLVRLGSRDDEAR